jgi:hypothetical protein
MGHRLILVMTGGLSTEYTTNGQFDMTKWKNKMDTYNTEAIRNAVAAAVSDGTVIANQMIDEPETRRWGGNITKATLDEMATYGHNMFPTLPMGLNHGPPGTTGAPPNATRWSTTSCTSTTTTSAPETSTPGAPPCWIRPRLTV